MYDTCFDQTAYISCDQAAVPIRTLAVESALDAVIHFALEFKNNSNEAFVGATGLVLPGSKFYLLGQLDLDTLTADQRTVEGVVRSKVFEKHRKTSVNVTIASLKDAYNIIPDLRQPQLQIGLHVDFNWNLSTPVNVPII